MKSLSACVIYKILGVFLLFCLSKASGGTCLSYGHSCWGGHGKRNSASQPIGSNTLQKHTGEWYASRVSVSSPEDSKNLESIFKSSNHNFEPYRYQIYRISDIVEKNAGTDPMDVEPKTKSTKWESESKEPEEVVVLTPEIQQFPLSKFRLFQIMNQEESKTRDVD